MICAIEQLRGVSVDHWLSLFLVCLIILVAISRLVLKCGLAHLNANERDESNANVQHLNKMQVKPFKREENTKESPLVCMYVCMYMVL